MSGLIALALALATMPAERPRGSTTCVSAERLLANETFRQFPVHPGTGASRAPDLRHGDAHLYRRLLKNEGDRVPDFAGHIRVVRIGCGAGSFCPAFVDQSNGRVTFAPELRVVSWMAGEPGVRQPENSERPTYRRDSSLLLVLGIRNEDERTAGATLYHWSSSGLHLLRFVPQPRLCAHRIAR
jgi:hypothetical protein